MRLLSVCGFAALFLGLGIATQGSPAPAQEVTEDWPQQANCALRQGNCELALELVHGARRTRDPGGDHFLAGLNRHGQENELSAPFIAYLYLKGLGARPNREAARQWFRKSALAITTVPPELRRLSMRASLGDSEIPPEFEEELDWLSGIEPGDAETKYELALEVRDGNGLDLDNASPRQVPYCLDMGLYEPHIVLPK